MVVLLVVGLDAGASVAKMVCQRNSACAIRGLREAGLAPQVVYSHTRRSPDTLGA